MFYNLSRGIGFLEMFEFFLKLLMSLFSYTEVEGWLCFDDYPAIWSVATFAIFEESHYLSKCQLCTSLIFC